MPARFPHLREGASRVTERVSRDRFGGASPRGLPHLDSRPPPIPYLIRSTEPEEMEMIFIALFVVVCLLGIIIERQWPE